MIMNDLNTYDPYNWFENNEKIKSNRSQSEMNLT